MIMMRPVPGMKKIYPGFEGLPYVSDRVYRLLKTKSLEFARCISPSVFDYYCATLAYEKLLRVQLENGYDITIDEENFIVNLKYTFAAVPSGLAEYLEAIGNTSVPSSCQLSAYRLIPKYEEGDGIPGFFGRATENTHHLYGTYPCLAVYAKRIQEDILKTQNPNRSPVWDLPNNIRPLLKDAGNPNENLLGWKKAQSLRDTQLNFLYRSGYKEDGTRVYEKQSLACNRTLINSLSNMLNNMKVGKNYSSTSITGSEAQIVKVCPEGARSQIALTQELIATSCSIIPDKEQRQGSALLYRVSRKALENQDRINNWCIYNFNNFRGVPREWCKTANKLRDLEPAILNYELFESTTYDLECAVRTFVAECETSTK